MKAIRNALLCALFVSGGAMASTAGLFQVPYDESLGGYTLSGHHMEWYGTIPGGLVINGYHMGEDWNRGSGSTDEGDRLNALADGKVIYVNHSGLSGKGKMVIVRYTLPNGDTVDGAYYHCKTIVVNDNDIVTPGQKIAELGGTSGISGFEYSPHLHWQMEIDPNLPVGANPYHGGVHSSSGQARAPMTPANALRYTSPSLFVDDRQSEEESGGFAMATGGYYTIFTMAGNAPSSTAYVERGGERKSLKKAIEAGWLNEENDSSNYPVLFRNDNGGWSYYLDIDDNFFEAGREYAVSANTSGAVLHILVPGNNFKDDRARIDMIRIANQDSRFNNAVPVGNPYGVCEGCNVRTETFAEDSRYSDPTHDYRKMAFMFTRSDGSTGGAYFYHATNVANPLIRYYKKYNIDTGTWSSWTQLDRNILY